MMSKILNVNDSNSKVKISTDVDPAGSAAAESRGQLAAINSALHDLQEKASGVSQLVEELKG